MKDKSKQVLANTRDAMRAKRASIYVSFDPLARIKTYRILEE